MFVATSDGQIVNMEHVVSAEETPSSGGYSVTFSDGSKKRLLFSVAGLDELTGTVVPAPPGYAVVEVRIPPVGRAADGVVCLDPRPVIAFRITGATSRPLPITAAGTASTSGGWTFAVRGPEGRWIGLDDEAYEHAADFQRACEQRLAEAVARRPRPVA